MSRLNSRILFALVALILSAGIGQAQPPPEPPGPDGAPAAEVLENLKVWHLTRQLKITPEQGARLFPLIQAQDRLLETHRQDHDQLAQRAKIALDLPPETRDAELQRLLAEWESGRQNFREQEDDLQQKIMGELSLEQQVRYLIFLKEFPQQVRKTMNEMRHRRWQRCGRGDFEPPSSDPALPPTPDRRETR